MSQKKAIFKKSKKTKVPSKVRVLKTSDLPATQLMLTTLRKQIKSEINSSEKSLESKFNLIESKINQIDSKLELVLTLIHRVVILMEEQNSRNACSMAMLHYMNRQDRLVLHFDAHEKILKI